MSNKKIKLEYENEAISEGINKFAIIAKTDLKGKITYVNEKFCEISGYTKEELIGKSHRIINSKFHSNHFFKNLWETILSGNTWKGEVKNKSKNGSFYWVDTIISPVFDINGKIKEFLSFRFDITENKQNEEKITLTNLILDKIVKEQIVLKDLLSIASKPDLSLSKKFNKSLSTILRLPWLEILSKAGVFLRKNDELILYSSINLGDKTESLCHKIKKGQCLCGKAFEKKETLHALHIDERHSISHEKMKDHGHYNIPILDSNKNVLGVIVFYLSPAHERSEEEVSFLESCANIFSRMIQIDKLKKKNLETQNFLNFALEGAGVGTIVWDLKNNSVNYDSRWKNLFGLDFNDSKNKISNFYDLIPEDEFKNFDENFKHFLTHSSEPFETYLRMKHSQGHYLTILLKVLISKRDSKNNPAHLICTFLDVTDHENTKRKISLLYDNSPFGFAFCDINGKLIEVNHKFEEITGYSTKELAQLTYWDLTPKKYEDDEAHQIELLKTFGKYGPYKKEYITKNQKHIPVELNGFIVKDFDGKEGIWSIIEDISEKIKSEKELQKQKNLATHNAKLASIGVLAGGVAHEINNPLAIIKGYLENLEHKLIKSKEIDEDYIAKTFSKIDKASQRISEIVKGLRAFSRSDTDVLLNFDPVDGIEESYNLIYEIYKKDNIDIQFNNQVEKKSVYIHGNRGKFQQILLNLITNAKDAVKNNNKKQIKIQLTQKNSNLIIEIKDNGKGISDDIKDKIFDPFFTTKGVNEGTGIGLSLVHKFIQELNGFVEIESKMNKGTLFKITFPIFSANEWAHEKSSKEEENYEQLTGTVLVVDDEEDVREILKEQLTCLGLKVTTANNGKSALDLIKKYPNRFEIVFSDMKMPKMDGETLLHSLRALDKINQPHFIFITGCVNSNNLESLLKNNLIQGYLYKPFKLNDIYKSIKDLVSLKNAS